MNDFILPDGLEALRPRRIWVCYPLIWNEKKHNGVGGYDKPPINPNTLRNAQTNREDSRATFDKAAAQIGKTAEVTLKGGKVISVKVAGVGIALEGTGVIGIDLDNVYDPEKRKITREALSLVKEMGSYVEISPSGTGVHILASGSLPDKMYKKVIDGRRDIFGTNRAEYQLFNSGYMTLSGNTKMNGYSFSERTKEVAQIYETYFKPYFIKRTTSAIIPPSQTHESGSPVVSSNATGFTYERWLEDVSRLDDRALLEAIYKSPRVGEKVKRLYNGDMSDYNNDHSRADQALATYLYSFTNSRSRMIELFKSSALFDDYAERRKSRGYLECTFSKAETDCERLIGHIEFTPQEKKAYAQMKQKQELQKKRNSRPPF